MNRPLLHIALPALLPLALVTGCENSCQQLCGEFIDYAFDCEAQGFDIQVDSNDLQECKDRQSDPSPEGLEACESGLEWVEITDSQGNTQKVPRIRKEWSCNDLKSNVLGEG